MRQQIYLANQHADNIEDRKLYRYNNFVTATNVNNVYAFIEVYVTGWIKESAYVELVQTAKSIMKRWSSGWIHAE